MTERIDFKDSMADIALLRKAVQLLEDAEDCLHITDGYVHHNDSSNRKWWIDECNDLVVIINDYLRFSE